MLQTASRRRRQQILLARLRRVFLLRIHVMTAATAVIKLLGAYATNTALVVMSSYVIVLKGTGAAAAMVARSRSLVTSALW